MSNFDNKAYFEKNFPAIENPLLENKISSKLKDWMKENRLKSITISLTHNGHDKLWISKVEPEE